MSSWVEIDGDFYNLDHLKNISIQCHSEGDGQPKFEIVFTHKDYGNLYPYADYFEFREEAVEEMKRVIGLGERAWLAGFR